MAHWLKTHVASSYDEVQIVFANTGQEHEETLEFVTRCNRAFGLGVVWVEAVTHMGELKGCTHRIVDYSTASRDGQPFKDVIAKYGIPNRTYPHCTRELKLNPMRSYIRELGWERYDTAIGIRCDEVDRMRHDAMIDGVIYPLITACPMSKPDINRFWSKQPFRLDLKGYEGNCKWCWKKSLRKHMTLISEAPERYEFPEQMEVEYGMVNQQPGYPARRFFLGNRTVADLRVMASQPFTPAFDDARVMSTRNMFASEILGELDASGGGCSDHCEVFHD